MWAALCMKPEADAADADAKRASYLSSRRKNK